MAVEIELEALAQHRLVDLADAALPGGAGVGDDDVDAAERFHHGVEGLGDRRRVGHVAEDRHCRAADSLGGLHRGRQIHVEQRDLGARRGKRLRGRRADRAAGAGDDGDLAGERRLLRGAELGLLERPVFAIEHVGFRDRLEAADRLRIGDALDRGFGDVGGDAGVALGAAEAEQAEARHQHDAGAGIEFMFDMADARIVLLEIAVIARGGISPAVSCATRANSASFPGSGAGSTSGQFLVRMVWSGVITPAWLVRAKLLGIDEIEHRIAGAEFEHEPAPGAFDPLLSFAAGAAHDRRHLRGVGAAACGAGARPETAACGRQSSSARETISIMRS